LFDLSKKYDKVTCLTNKHTDKHSLKGKMETDNSLFKPIKTKRISEQVIANIKQLIFKGVLKMGDTLPPEIELARKFNVSRQTVREALSLLELSGFISLRKRGIGGSVIQNTILNTISSAFVDAVQMEKVGIDELTSARIEIERTVLKHAIENADEADIQRLQQNVLQAINKTERGIQAFSENIQFHILLAKASKNYVFVTVVTIIMAVVADFLSTHEPDLEKSRHVIESHHELVDALKKGEGKTALNLLEQHLVEVASWL